jgi:hypothetical protein
VSGQLHSAWERTPGRCCIRRRVGPTPGLDAVEGKSLLPMPGIEDKFFEQPTGRLVTMTTELTLQQYEQ